MERVDGEAGMGAFLFDAVDHPGCGLVGEGECQGLVWRDALVYKMQDFFCYYPRFAGAGAGEDELDAVGCDGALLGGGEGHLLEVGAGGG